MNIIIDVDGNGYRTWVYSTADCSAGDAHLKNIKESELEQLLNKMMSGYNDLTNDEISSMFRLKIMHNLNTEKRVFISEFIEDNRTNLTAKGYTDEFIDNSIYEILNVKFKDYVWSDSIRY